MLHNNLDIENIIQYKLTLKLQDIIWYMENNNLKKTHNIITVYYNIKINQIYLVADLRQAP